MEQQGDDIRKTSTVQIVVCDKHGLRYDALTEIGCVRCRKEAGGSSGGAATADAPASMPAQLGIAAGMVLVLGLAFFGTHQNLIASFERGSEGLGDLAAFGGGAEYQIDYSKLRDPEIIFLFETEPSLQRAIEEDRELRNALDTGDMAKLREYLAEHGIDDGYDGGYGGVDLQAPVADDYDTYGDSGDYEAYDSGDYVDYD